MPVGSSARPSSDSEGGLIPPKKSHEPKRRPGVKEETPARALAVTLEAWLAHPEIRATLREAAEATAAGRVEIATTDDIGAHQPGPRGQEPLVIGSLVERVARQLPAARREAEHAARCLREWRARDPANLDPAQHELVVWNEDRDLDDVDGWALEFAAGRARAVAFEWHDDGPQGNTKTLRKLGRQTRWWKPSVALGRRFAGVCLKCGKPLRERRATNWTEHSVRRDYHDSCEPPPPLVLQRERAIERLLPLLARALDA